VFEKRPGTVGAMSLGRLGGEEGVETAVGHEPTQLRIAANATATDHDLRDSPAACQSKELLSEGRPSTQVAFLEVNAVLIEQVPCRVAVAAPTRRVHRHPVHICVNDVGCVSLPGLGAATV